MIITLLICVDVKWQNSQQPSLFPKFLLCHWQTTPLSFENTLLWWLRHSRSKSILRFQGIFLHNPFARSWCSHLLGNFLVACICAWRHFLGVWLYSNSTIGCQNFERVLCLILPSCLVESVSFAILHCQSYLRECISRRVLLNYSEGSVFILRWYCGTELFAYTVVSCLDMYCTKVLMYRTMVLMARPTKVRP